VRATRLKAISSSALRPWQALSGRLPPLVRNGYALVFSSAAGSGLGLVYWALAARLYPSEVVGLNSALLSSMLFLSGLSQLGLNSVLVRFLPVAGGSAGRLIWRAYAGAAGLSALAALVFVLGLRLWAPALAPLASPGLFGLLALTTAAWSIFTLQDSVLIGLRRAPWAAVENTSFALVKIGLLAVLAWLLPEYGVFASWVLPLGLLLLLVNGLIFRRLLPAHPGYLEQAAPEYNRRQAWSFVGGNYLGSLFFTASLTLIPLMVANQAGSAANAYFYLPWTITLALQYAALHMTSSFTVESALAPEQAAAYSYRIFIQTLRLLVPAVIFLLLAAHPVLLIFGPEYANQSTPLLRLLALAALPNAALALFVGVARLRRQTRIIAAAYAAVFGLAYGLGSVLIGPLGITGVGAAWLVSQAVVGGAALLSLLPLLRQGRKAAHTALPPFPELDSAQASPGEENTNNATLVSVIISNFNYAQYLGEAIESALAQTYHPLEVIVVDDGSTDRSRQVIAAYGERIRRVLQANGGQAAALNAGFAASRGEIIFFLDADDRLEPGIAAAVVQAVQENPSAGRVHFLMNTIDAQGKPRGLRKPAAHLALPVGDLRRAVLAFPEDLPWLPTSGNAYRAAVLRCLMPIPPDEFRILADFYLSHLSALYGPLVALERVGASYRVHGANHHEPSRRAVDMRLVRQALQHWDRVHAHLRRHARRLDLPLPERTLSVTLLANRLISLRLEPQTHPIPGDSRLRLAFLAGRAILRRFDSPLRRKLIYAGWFAAMLLAPRRWAERLGEMFLFGRKDPSPPAGAEEQRYLPQGERGAQGSTALIISHNTAPDLRACLESLPAHVPGRVMVVDNASSDGSPELVKAHFPHVLLVESPSNRGYGAAANLGAAACDSRYILLLNSDTRLEAGTLERLAEYMDHHPRAAVAGPRLLNPDGSPQASRFHFPTPGRLLQRETSLQRLVPAFPQEAGPVPWVLGAALMIRREAFEAVGGFDEDFFLYYEEVDLCLRLRQAGWEIHYAPVVDVIHTGGASTSQQPGGMTRQLYASLERFYRKHYRSPLGMRMTQLRLVITYLMLRNIVRDRLLTRRGERGAEHGAGRETDWSQVLRQAWQVRHG
jgi:GT2 family glycosyltransferase/O-antigen/teichoic acid export membrane protein